MGWSADGRAGAVAVLEHFAATSLAAEDADGALTGFLIGFDSPDHPGEAYVHFVGVRPDRRGSGLGRELHDRFAREAGVRGITAVRCLTSTVNTASVAFHTAIGFEVEGADAEGLTPHEMKGLFVRLYATKAPFIALESLAWLFE